MTTQEIVDRLWRLCDVLRDDGITYHLLLSRYKKLSPPGFAGVKASQCLACFVGRSPLVSAGFLARQDVGRWMLGVSTDY